MKRNRRMTVRFPIFGNYKIIVIQSDNLVRTGRLLDAEIGDNEAAWISRPEAMHCHLIFKFEVDAETIAHEACHAIRGMFNALGVIGKQDDEAFAYHLGHLVGRLHKFLR